MLERTQPTRPMGMDAFQPIPVVRGQSKRKRTRNPFRTLLLALLLVYFFGPFRTNMLLLGTDGSNLRGSTGRTDTIILATIDPLRSYTGMMGIPRDLWLPIAEVGEQRINTAYFFAEYARPGSGPAAIMNTVEQNFGVRVHYYAVIRMEGLVEVVDALGGVDIVLDHKAAGLKKGRYHMNGSEALAFARERYSSDDFSRMEQGQILIQAIAAKMMALQSWPRLPYVLMNLANAVDTNIPAWQWPRLAFCILRASWLGIDTRTISSGMVFPLYHIRRRPGSGAQLGPDQPEHERNVWIIKRGAARRGQARLLFLGTPVTWDRSRGNERISEI